MSTLIEKLKTIKQNKEALGEIVERILPDDLSASFDQYNQIIEGKLSSLQTMVDTFEKDEPGQLSVISSLSEENSNLNILTGTLSSEIEDLKGEVDDLREISSDLSLSVETLKGDLDGAKKQNEEFVELCAQIEEMVDEILM